MSLEEVLAAREQRAARQQQALATDPHGCVISLTVLAPGPVKDTAISRRAHDAARRVISDTLAGHDLRWEPAAYLPTGPESLAVVGEQAQLVKQLMVRVEEDHLAGRLFDIDVRDRRGAVDRAAVGCQPRSCLVCDHPAHACARARAHELDEVLAAIDDLWARHTWQVIGELAAQALTAEVELTPKPGLVDQANAGAHTDMDIHTMRAGVEALRPHLPEFARIGAQTAQLDPAAAFDQLRQQGIRCEHDMFEATSGINTHKGAVFAMALACGAAGRLDAQGHALDPEAVCTEVSRLAAPTLDELGQDESTTGQRLYRALRLTGARGEAASGFVSVREHALPALRRARAAGASTDEARCEALLELLAVNEDTTLAGDGGLDAIVDVRTQARAIVDRGGHAAPDFIDRIRRLDVEMTQRGWSPGGCADLLAITLLLDALDTQF